MHNIITLFLSSAEGVALEEAILTIGLSLALGIVIGLTYKLTTKDYSNNFFITLTFIPAVIGVIILLIGSNVARAFSLAGAFSIIRFRSAPGNPKDITYVLFAMAAGLAAGIGCYVYALIFTSVLCAFMAIEHKISLKGAADSYILKISVPESLNFKGAFDDVIKSYTKGYSLCKIKTADMGSIFEITYRVTINSSADIKAFMDDLRCRNGNLTVMLSLDGDKEF